MKPKPPPACHPVLDEFVPVGLDLFAVSAPGRKELHEDRFATHGLIPGLLCELFGAGQTKEKKGKGSTGIHGCTGGKQEHTEGSESPAEQID